MIKRNATYNRIGKRLIQNLEELEHIRDSLCRVVFLASDEAKVKNRKVVYGECIKVQKNYEWCCPYDFMIVIYEPNCFDFTRKQIEILIEHELHHIGIDDDGNEPSFYIVPHDVEEFWDLIKKYGIDWSVTDA